MGLVDALRVSKHDAEALSGGESTVLQDLLGDVNQGTTRRAHSQAAAGDSQAPNLPVVMYYGFGGQMRNESDRDEEEEATSPPLLLASLAPPPCPP